MHRIQKMLAEHAAQSIILQKGNWRKKIVNFVYFLLIWNKNKDSYKHGFNKKKQIFLELFT